MTIACILEPEPSTMKEKRPSDAESSIMAERHVLNSNPNASTVTDNRTSDPESSAIRIEPLHHTSYRTQADALFRKNLTFQVPYTQPDIQYL